MESARRTLAKAISWQVCGLFSMTLVGWLITGSAAQSGAIAGAGMAIGFVSYVVHERLWARIRWGLAPDGALPDGARPGGADGPRPGRAQRRALRTSAPARPGSTRPA